MWAELQSETKCMPSLMELTLLKPTEEDWVYLNPKSKKNLLNARLSNGIIEFCGVFLSIPWPGYKYSTVYI